VEVLVFFSNCYFHSAGDWMLQGAASGFTGSIEINGAAIDRAAHRDVINFAPNDSRYTINYAIICATYRFANGKSKLRQRDFVYEKFISAIRFGVEIDF
jgi:hypothetical protein